MIDTILLIVFVLIAIAMLVLILLQRGPGAQAGSGFGAGASGTVFGARGSANFMVTATKYLAFIFFGLSLFMAWKAVNINKPVATDTDIGVMSGVPSVPESKTPALPASLPTQTALPSVPSTTSVPVATVPAAETVVPATPVSEKDKQPKQ